MRNSSSNRRRATSSAETTGRPSGLGANWLSNAAMARHFGRGPHTAVAQRQPRIGRFASTSARRQVCRPDGNSEPRTPHGDSSVGAARPVASWSGWPSCRHVVSTAATAGQLAFGPARPRTRRPPHPVRPSGRCPRLADTEHVERSVSLHLPPFRQTLAAPRCRMIRTQPRRRLRRPDGAVTPAHEVAHETANTEDLIVGVRRDDRHTLDDCPVTLRHRCRGHRHPRRRGRQLTRSARRRCWSSSLLTAELLPGRKISNPPTRSRTTIRPTTDGAPEPAAAWAVIDAWAWSNGRAALRRGPETGRSRAGTRRRPATGRTAGSRCADAP